MVYDNVCKKCDKDNDYLMNNLDNTCTQKITCSIDNCVAKECNGDQCKWCEKG